MVDLTGEENDGLLAVKIAPGAWGKHFISDEVVSRSRMGACFATKYNQDHPDDSSGGSYRVADRVILSDCHRIRCGNRRFVSLIQREVADQLLVNFHRI